VWRCDATLWPNTTWWGVIGGRKTGAIHIIIRWRWSFAGLTLDEHGYLVDIVDVETHLDALVAYFRDKTLNELPEFAGLNPSIEHFSRIFCQRLKERLQAATLEAVGVKIWETGIAWAAYREEV
jgi:6-pyruvoyl-tetrahydropterin synthase